MRSRAFNKRVEVWETSVESDGFGGNTNTELLINNSWAKMETSSKNKSSLNTEFGLLDASNYIKVTVRQRNDLTIDLQSMYLMYNDEKYIIKSYPENVDFKDNIITFNCVKEIKNEPNGDVQANDLNAALNIEL